MMRATLLVLVPLASALWLRPAEACVCDPAQNEILHPSGDLIPAQDGLAGWTWAVQAPAITVVYADDPAATPIVGDFQQFGATWTFVPTDPLTVGRTVRAEVRATDGGTAPVASDEFLVTSSTIGAPPSFAGITGIQVILSRIQRVPEASCIPNGDTSRVILDGLEPTTEGAPLRRYYIYRQGTPPPTEPTMHGVSHRAFSGAYCGNQRLRCVRDLPIQFQPGETWCARVESADLRGNRSGYDREACATVVVEDVEVYQSGAMSMCRPFVETPDAGPVVPDTGLVLADAGATGLDAGVAAVDAGSGSGGGDSDGCTCVRPRAGGAYAGLASVLLVMGWVVGRRRARA